MAAQAPTVICLGEMLWDCLANDRDRPAELVQSWTPWPGGAPANVATALVKLGVESGLITCLGSDPEGDRLFQVLQDNAVAIAAVQRHPSLPTRQVQVLRSAQGDRQFGGFGAIACDQFADTELQADQLPQAWFSSAKVLCLGTIPLAYPSSAIAAQQALNWANQQGMTVLLDVNWRPSFWPDSSLAPDRIRAILPQIQQLKLAREEAEWLFETVDPAQIQSQQPHLEAVLITDGDRGCDYWVAGWQGYCPSFPVEAIDTTGAGDAFVAAWLAQNTQTDFQWTSAEQVQTAIRWASAAGALTTLQAGAIAAQPSLSEVQTFLLSNSSAQPFYS
ncbi:carbohydrate kinase [Synechococcus elongatus IITB7]|uniref:carbohydrate kinase family protein n=1 Tax=Synechococcus elongatus TaxID=32046 RepID=UPI0030D3E739